MTGGTLRANFPAAAIAIAIVLLGHFIFSAPAERPYKDALRYSDYALNIVEYNTFGITDSDGITAVLPGNANAPLYPLFVSAVIAIDDKLFASLACARADPLKQHECPQDYQTLIAVQYILVWFTLMLLWQLVRQLFNNPILSGLAVAFAFLSMSYTDYAHRVLTENFIFPGVICLQLGLLLFYRQRRKRWAALIGLALGALTLTRPEYLYLSMVIALTSMTLIIMLRQPRGLIAFLIGITVFSLTLAPWLWRNHQQFDSWALTGGGYAETIMAHRLSFNRMSFTEWGAAFVYWLPDFGDKMANRFLPEDSYRRFVGRNPDSFSATALSDILQPELAQRPREEIVGHWIRSEIIGNIFQHTAVTLPLAWRGMFVCKYWGIFGLFGYAVLLIHSVKRGRYQLLLLSTPVLFMVALYAGISASIPRYNLPLIPLYSIGLAWVTHRIIRRRWQPDWAPVDYR